MFKREFSKCSVCDCDSERLIVNRTKWLCEEKNRERLDRGRVKRRSKQMKSQTKSRSKIESRYLFEKKKLMDETGYCNNCGTSDRLSCSHLIPRSYRTDLIDNAENLVIHCMDGDGIKGCHSRWEEKDTTMNDYESNMERVKNLDIQYYRLLMMKRK